MTTIRWRPSIYYRGIGVIKLYPEEEAVAERPHWRINALNKNTGEQGELGVAWNDTRGHISLKFNPYVVIPTGQDIVITMFPITPKDDETKLVVNAPAGPKTPVTHRFDDSDEIPF